MSQTACSPPGRAVAWIAPCSCGFPGNEKVLNDRWLSMMTRLSSSSPSAPISQKNSTAPVIQQQLRLTALKAALHGSLVQLVRAFHDELMQICAKRGRCVGLDTSHAKALAVRAPGERDARSAAPVVTRMVRQSGDNALVVGNAAARAAAKLSGPIRAARGRGHGLKGRSTSSTNIIAFTTGSSATCAIAMAESRARAVTVMAPGRL